MIEVVVFDWGDTVMRDFRTCSGPMASWPRVEAVSGVEQVLRTLHPRYRLALATNATDSNETLVRQALERVGFDRFFEKVFVSSDLGVEKPDPKFFAAVLAGLQLQPHQVVMVGDNYANDVRGAKAAGLWTVWFDPGCGPAPGAAADHDAEIADFSRLEAALVDFELRAAQTDAAAEPGAASQTDTGGSLPTGGRP